MNETDYNARLYEKMKAEQDKYRDWLLHQEPSEILNHTYEYTMRADIVMCIQPKETERQNRIERRQRDLEVEIRVLPTALMALSG